MAPTIDLAYDRGGLPYPVPAAGAPLRLAFVGRSAVHAARALDQHDERLRTAFVDWREGDPGELLGALRRERPHVVVVFEPAALPEGIFAGLDAFTIGVGPEGLSSPDLDRVRPLTLPVADRYFAEVAPIRGKLRSLFVGRSSKHREAWLDNPKYFHDVLHVAEGMDAGRLEDLLREHHVGIALHERPKEPGFLETVPLHLAAGHLVVSEKLTPSHGLEAGIDYIEVDHPRDLLDVIYTLERFPAMHDRIRIRGRMKAEQFRASVVWPRLVHDLMLDLRSFGTSRTG